MMMAKQTEEEEETSAEKYERFQQFQATYMPRASSLYSWFGENEKTIEMITPKAVADYNEVLRKFNTITVRTTLWQPRIPLVLPLMTDPFLTKERLFTFSGHQAAAKTLNLSSKDLILFEKIDGSFSEIEYSRSCLLRIFAPFIFEGERYVWYMASRVDPLLAPTGKVLDDLMQQFCYSHINLHRNFNKMETKMKKKKERKAVR